MQDPKTYLSRIGATRWSTLADLHERHQLSVPFENLDIVLGTPIRLDEAGLLDKIVTRRRGGYCYELNGAFAWLLGKLGFSVTMLEARVPPYRVPFDHLCLRVDLERAWLVDVGFGESFLYPLPLDGEVLHKVGARYRVRTEGAWRFVERDGKPIYRFSLEPRALADFEPGNRYHQTSPDSTLSTGLIWSLALPAGRVTVTDSRLIETRKNERTETAIEDPWAVLRERFGVKTGSA